MIRVELGEEVKRRGKWRYIVTPIWRDGSRSQEYVSSQPLLDACRLLNASGTPSTAMVGLFRPGRDKPDLTCMVGWGAVRMVDESKTPYFHKWNPRPLGTWSQQKD